MNQEHQPVTRADLDRHKAELIDAFRAVVQETVPGLVLTVVQETVPGLVRAVVQETVPDLIHAIVQETETKLLSAFFSYQEHAEIKYRKLSADVTNVNAAAELRLGNLESRVIELEKRVLRGGPPQ
ncbi:MAG: hypothetical protein AAB654_26810 [Acidobacteriota bacterium]